jgi:hypothetical protein
LSCNIDNIYMFGNPRLKELKAAFENAHIPKNDSLLYEQCKEIVEDAQFKAASGSQKGLCIFNFNYGQCSFAIGATSRSSVTQSCIVITGQTQIGIHPVDIKINCTQNFPTDFPQVFFSPVGSESFLAFPFATLPPPGGSQHWNFCAGTKLIHLLRAMVQYMGPLPSSSAVAPVPVLPPAVPQIATRPPSQYEYKVPEIAQSQIAATFSDKSPMQFYYENPNAAHQVAVGQTSLPSPGWPSYPISPVAPSPQQLHTQHSQQQQYGQPPASPAGPYLAYADPPSHLVHNPYGNQMPPNHGQLPAYNPHGHSAQPPYQHASDAVPTPPIMRVQMPVPPSDTPGPPPPPPIAIQSYPNAIQTYMISHTSGRVPSFPFAPPPPIANRQNLGIYSMGFELDAVQRALAEASQDEQRAIEILLSPPIPVDVARPPPPASHETPSRILPPPGLPPNYQGPPVGLPPQVAPPRTAIREFTIVLNLESCDIPMCVRAANYSALLAGIKSEIGDIPPPELNVDGGKWVSMSTVNFGDLPESITIRLPPSVPVAPSPHYRQDPPPGLPPQEPRRSPPPPISPVDDIAAHGSYPIVKSADIIFDVDSTGKRIELGHGVFKAVYRGKFFGTPVAVRVFLVIFLRSLQFIVLTDQHAS